MITFNAVPTDAAATGLYIESENQSNIISSLIAPREIYIFGQYNSGKSPTANVPKRIFSKAEAWELYGRGSLLALMIDKALANSGDQVPVFAVPLADAGTAVAATGAITVTGTATANGTLSVMIGGQNVKVAVSSGDTATDVGDALEAAITAAADLPVTGVNTAGAVALTAKFAGEAGNDIPLSVNYFASDETPAGLSVAITAMSSGANNPVLTTAIANLPENYGMDIVCPYNDSVTMTVLQALGESRYLPDIHRPLASFVPYSDTLANYTTFLDSYNTQWITTVNDYNLLESPSFELIAGTVGQFSKSQKNKPGVPITSTQILGITPKNSVLNLKQTQKDSIVKAGGSWISVTDDSRVQIGDLVTTRTETDQGAPDPDWRFTSTIANLQTKIYSMAVVFRSPPFINATVVDNDAVVSVDYAVRPSLVKAYLIRIIDELWIPLALSKNRAEIIASIQAEIDNANASRINLEFTDVMAAGLRIIAVKHNWLY